MLSAPWSRGTCRGLVAGALALMAWGCAPVTFESLAKRCVRERLDEPACAEVKLALIAQQGVPGDSGSLVCKGGFQDGESCSTNDDCRREAVCWQGRNHGESCTTNFDCNEDPNQGSNLCFHAPTIGCDADADCPGVCEVSGVSCNGDADCGAPVCQGGFRDGESCSNDAFCTQCMCSTTAQGDPSLLGSFSCTLDADFNSNCTEFMCNATGFGGLTDDSCNVSSDCESGVCWASVIRTLIPATCGFPFRCEERSCLNDWVICIGRGFCVPEGALGKTTI